MVSQTAATAIQKEAEMSFQLHTGMSVRDVRGRPVGTLAKIAGNRFAVTTDKGRVWLEPAVIFTVDPGTSVTLQCNSEQVSRYSVPAPTSLSGLR